MPYVVTENCIRCKYMDCVAVCPVDCFREGESMLVIDPDLCIDCGVCVPECPAHAIAPDASAAGWVAFNARYASAWPAIERPGERPADAANWDGVPGKLLAAFGTADPSHA
ncbi:ferredoxin FdxA [Hydrogenophaga sp. SNF1]|uniref:ferredoxin FdxA n=1 Tax=Hydrogenophaga sp. SNF1 TaxID=3098762 RepID=UPI002ACC2818|nr:ferredoxin FdxA [Hydrogenophaga sp. SNF1]WQB84951.1 ferredoxin FdxA [Hydrogenophaga sp. SNF1]